MSLFASGSRDLRAVAVHAVLSLPSEHAGRQDGGSAQLCTGHLGIFLALRVRVVRARRLRAASAAILGLLAAAVAAKTWKSIGKGPAGGSFSCS